MRQKYRISRDDAHNQLTISEYAVTDIDFKNVPSAMLPASGFTRLGEETYKDDQIVPSIAKGVGILVATLRTDNLFPIEPHAVKIAESIVALYDSNEDQAIELIFEDDELISA